MIEGVKMPEPLAPKANVKDAIRWVRNLVVFVGPGFHPDSSFHDYVTDDGVSSFSQAECRFLEREMARAWKILDKAGVEIYRVALTVQRRLLRQMIQRR
jgi:hypothetical protein